MKVTQKEIGALEAIRIAGAVLVQILEYNRPGKFKFRELFPREYAVMTNAAALFIRSKKLLLRRLGVTMREFIASVAAVDAAEAETADFHTKIQEMYVAAVQWDAAARALDAKVAENSD
ncbi:hypothetical protein ACFSR7_23615 [Cohnella sp. GCM10020058]|uniref:hypothetical protein n=1 Tax=Cohnella sp. GCM10020058 TaxID=3317330 RepID=UPI003634A55A